MTEMMPILAILLISTVSSSIPAVYIPIHKTCLLFDIKFICISAVQFQPLLLSFSKLELDSSGGNINVLIFQLNAEVVSK